MTATHIGILIISLAAFAALAFATERHGVHLLGKLPAATWQRGARIAGWVLLAVALVLGVGYLGTSIGITLWLGWLSIAALALVFYLPKWPWQPAARKTPARKTPARDAAAGAEAEAAAATTWARVRRPLALALLVATPVVFTGFFLAVEAKPLERSDVIRGQVGPWTYALAESDRDPPELVDMNVPLKAFTVRFCEACDLQIRGAYLKVNQPRSMRATGMGLEGARWNRRVEIQLPSNLTATSELWMTVVGKDGSVHQVSWPMSRVSPATVAWFEQERKRNEGN